MELQGSVGYITGGQSGLGAALSATLLERGAIKVYVASRHPVASDDARIVPVELDVRDPGAVERAAREARDVTVLVNNAGIHLDTPLLNADIADVRAEFDTNALGLMLVTRAFAPVLAANGGGAVLNVLALLSWLSAGDAYSASKAAAWSMTNGLRAALRPAGTQVTALMAGFVDTPMTAEYDTPKSEPRTIADAALSGVAAGDDEVLADEDSRRTKQMLTGPPAHLVFG